MQWLKDYLKCFLTFDQSVEEVASIWLGMNCVSSHEDIVNVAAIREVNTVNVVDTMVNHVLTTLPDLEF